jgi:two-component system NtrC family response regulator
MTDLRILIVDDSEVIREMLASYLGTLGYRVDVATDGQSALDKFLIFRYELIISDLQMPYIDGLSLLKQVKALAAKTQVIILTGHATLDSAVEALRLGAYDYQFKPLEDIETSCAADRERSTG